MPGVEAETIGPVCPTRRKLDPRESRRLQCFHMGVLLFEEWVGNGGWGQRISSVELPGSCVASVDCPKYPGHVHIHVRVQVRLHYYDSNERLRLPLAVHSVEVEGFETRLSLNSPIMAWANQVQVPFQAPAQKVEAMNDFLRRCYCLTFKETGV